MKDEIEPTVASALYVRPSWVTPVVWIWGIGSALFVILSKDATGPQYLDQVGKALFWTGAVFVPVIAVNLRELSTSSGQKCLALLALLHICFVAFAFHGLAAWSFVTLTPAYLLEILLSNVALAKVSKRMS